MSDSQASTLPKPPVSLSAIAACTPGAQLHGNGALLVADLVHPRMVTGPDQMVLILEAAALGLIPHSPFPVKAAVVAEGIEVPEGLLEGYVSVARPRLALATLLSIFEKPLHAPVGIHPTAFIEASAQVHPTASIGAFAYVGENAMVGAHTVIMPHVTVGADVKIAADCVLHSGVRLGERVMLCNRVVIHHNASIGADGFSFL